MNALDRAISLVGGVGKLAAALGVGQPVVSNWKSRGTTPDAAHCVAIESATRGQVRRQDLRPDDWRLIWPELVKAKGAPKPADQKAVA